MQPDNMSTTYSNPLPSNASVSPRIQIDWATSDEDRHDVYRLRYIMLVDKLQYPMLSVDHDLKLVSDPQDQYAQILIARDSATKQCVGTLRTNVLSNCNVGIYEDLLSLKAMDQKDRARTSVTSKLVISNEVPHSRLLLVRLAITMYIFGIDTGLVADYVAVRSSHVRFYTHLGYQNYKQQVIHPDGGALSALRLEVGNYKQLEIACKPFAGVFKECMDRAETRKPSISKGNEC